MALSSQASATHVEITDMDAMYLLMQRNIQLNNLPAELVQASILDWGTPTAGTAQPDIVLAADCVYFEPAFPLLLTTMNNVIGPDTICYFCFKKRRKADMRFLKDCKKEFVVEDIGDDPDKAVWSRQGLFL